VGCVWGGGSLSRGSLSVSLLLSLLRLIPAEGCGAGCWGGLGAGCQNEGGGAQLESLAMSDVLESWLLNGGGYDGDSPLLLRWNRLFGVGTVMDTPMHSTHTTIRRSTHTQRDTHTLSLSLSAALQ
jgi:hypothetical protein